MKSKFLSRIFSLLSVLAIITLLLSSCSNFANVQFTLNKDNITLTVGDTTTLTSNIEYETPSWSSSDEKVATVENGTVVAHKKGTATITAMLSNGNKALCVVTVKEVEIEKIVLNETSLSLKVGKRKQLKATVSPENAPEDNILWESANENVAAVDNNGLVTAVKKGTTIVRCYSKDEEVIAECTVTVKAQKKKETTTTIINNYSYDNYSYDDSYNYVNTYEPFYGIFCISAKVKSNAENVQYNLWDYGYQDSAVYITNQWSNLNSDFWYTVTAGHYSSKEEAQRALPYVQDLYPDAYVKYSGEYTG